MTEQTLDLLYIAIDLLQAMLICRFLIRFTGAPNRPLYYLSMGILFLALDLLFLSAAIDSILSKLLVFVLFFLFSLCLLRKNVLQSLTGALVILVITSVLGNITASVLLIASATLPVRVVFIINLALMAGSILILWLLLRYIATHFSFVREDRFPYLFTLWLPLIMIFVFSEAFAWATTGNTVIIDAGGYAHMLTRLNVSGWWGLLIFLFALGCIMILFFSYQKFKSFYMRQQQVAQMEQELGWQKKAVNEALLRYNSTKAFQHDLSNHLSVLSGLMHSRQYREAQAYLEKTTGLTQTLSGNIHSGSLILDVLLDDKLTVAKQAGIRLECHAETGNTSIDDYDLCIFVGNALDNAIKACESVPPGERYIYIDIARQKDFLYLQIRNAKTGVIRKGQGYGLRNMRTVADKYNGSMEASDHGSWYELNAIFSIP